MPRLHSLKAKTAQADWSVVIPKLPGPLLCPVAEKLSLYFGLSQKESQDTVQNTPIVLFDCLEFPAAQKIKELFAETGAEIVLTRDTAFIKKCYRILWPKDTSERSGGNSPAVSMAEKSSAALPKEADTPLQDQNPWVAELEKRLKNLEAHGQELQRLIDQRDQTLRTCEEMLRQEKQLGEQLQELLGRSREEVEDWKDKYGQSVSQNSALVKMNVDLEAAYRAAGTALDLNRQEKHQLTQRMEALGAHLVELGRKACEDLEID